MSYNDSNWVLFLLFVVYPVLIVWGHIRSKKKKRQPVKIPVPRSDGYPSAAWCFIIRSTTMAACILWFIFFTHLNIHYVGSREPERTENDDRGSQSGSRRRPTNRSRKVTPGAPHEEVAHLLGHRKHEPVRACLVAQHEEISGTETFLDRDQGRCGDAVPAEKFVGTGMD